jgi:hypothetical protein
MQKASILRRAIAVGLVSILSFGTIAAVPAAAKDNTTTSLQVPVVGTTSTVERFRGRPSSRVSP